jgi:hypothetical protein
LPRYASARFSRRVPSSLSMPRNGL